MNVFGVPSFDDRSESPWIRRLLPFRIGDITAVERGANAYDEQAGEYGWLERYGPVDWLDEDED